MHDPKITNNLPLVTNIYGLTTL